MTFLTESRLSVVLARGARKGSFSAHLSGKPTFTPSWTLGFAQGVISTVHTPICCGYRPS